MNKVKVAPLNSGFMATSILGFFISVFFIAPRLSFQWGTTFAIFFVIMFIASFVSMTYAEPKTSHIDKLVVGRLKKK